MPLDHVTASDSTPAGRSIVLLLTGAGGDDTLTATVQRIARDFISRGGANDRVSVVRIAHRNDEVAGIRDDMLMRIAEYRAPYGRTVQRQDLGRGAARRHQDFATDGD